jgi:hypothetical protein
MNIPFVPTLPTHPIPPTGDAHCKQAWQRFTSEIGVGATRIFPEWLDQCVEFVKTEILRGTPVQTAQHVWQQFLGSNLSDIAYPAFQELPQRAVWKNNVVLQVVNVLEVGSSVQSMHTSCEDELNRRKYGGTGPIRFDEEEEDAGVTQVLDKTAVTFPRGMLKLTLSDGHTELIAMEKKIIPGLDMHTSLGCKLLVSGPLQIRRGILQLESERVKVLGGMIEEWNPCIQAAGGAVAAKLENGRYDLMPDILPRLTALLDKQRQGAPIPLAAVKPKKERVKDEKVKSEKSAELWNDNQLWQPSEGNFKTDDLFDDDVLEIDLDHIDAIANPVSVVEFDWNHDMDLDVPKLANVVEPEVIDLCSQNDSKRDDLQQVDEQREELVFDDDVIDLIASHPLSITPPKIVSPTKQDPVLVILPTTFKSQKSVSSTENTLTSPTAKKRFQIVNFSALNVKSIQTAAGKEKQWLMSLDISDAHTRSVTTVAMRHALIVRLIGYTPTDMRYAKSNDPMQLEKIKDSILKLEGLLEKQLVVDGELDKENALIQLGPPFAL